MENFMVEVALNGPVIRQFDAWLTLDSLLGAAIYRRTGNVRAATEELPLARSGAIWHGSAMFLINAIPARVRFIADLNPVRGDYNEPHLERPKRVLRTGGRTKAMIDEYSAWHATHAVWFGRGETSAVKQLLADLPGVGKKVSQGYGQIDNIQIRTLSVDRSLFLPDGSVARPIPQAALPEGITDGPMDVTTWSPPYWNKDKVALCRLPKTGELSPAHIAHVDEGKSPLSLPNDPPISATRWQSGIDFFADHLGYKLQEAEGLPGVPSGDGACDICGKRGVLVRSGAGAYTAMCGTCYTFAGRYEKIRRPGRMGAGWMGMVTPAGAQLVTSVAYEPEEVPFTTIPNLKIEVGKSALNRLINRIVFEPPEPPFLFFVSDASSPRVVRNLTVSWSTSRAWYSGATRFPLNLTAMRKTIQDWEASELTLNELGSLARIATEIRYSLNEQTREKAQQLWEKKRGPENQDLVNQIPLPGSEAYSVFMQAARCREEKVAHG